VTAVILDAGALVAVDRGDRRMLARLLAAHTNGDTLVTNAMVVAQAWRDDRRQAVLARFLRGVEVRSIDEATGRAAGRLLGMTGSSDPVDAALVLLATRGDRIVTSDPRDLSILAEAAGLEVTIVPC
jgi:hypothetical protein